MSKTKFEPYLRKFGKYNKEKTHQGESFRGNLEVRRLSEERPLEESFRRGNDI